ncbi:MAG: hypothetical protein OEZ34_03155 [Spirochaetia bacterium]|nr:hypothetical protein [Spirochaetia bacterium]
MPEGMDTVLTGILKTSLAASVCVNSIFRSGTYSVDKKKDNSHLTGADLLSNRICHKGLLATLPGSGWLSEESLDAAERLNKEDVWIVDPIDGTREFVEGVGEFSVSIGLSRNGYPEYGSIAIPHAGRVLLGNRKDGTFRVSYNPDELLNILNAFSINENTDADEFYEFFSQKWDEILKICIFPQGAISKETDLKAARILVSKSEWKKGKFDEFKKDLNLIPSGSVARKLGLISAGEGDLSVSLTYKNDWDICGGTSLVLSSGGEVIDLNHFQRRTFNQEDPLSFGLIAGNQILVKKFQDYLQNKKLWLER